MSEAILAEATSTPMECLVKGEKVGIPRALVVLAAGIPVLIILFQLFSGWYTSIDPRLQRMFVCYLLVLGAFALYPLGRKHWSDPLGWPFGIDALCMLITCALGFYAFWDGGAMLERIGRPSSSDMFAGTLTIILVLEACRRTIGWALPIVCIIFLLQNLFGEQLPGPLYGPSFSWQRLIETLYVQDLGIFGVVMRIMVNYLILFYMFAAFMRLSGAGEMFTNLALAVAGRYTGGPAKAAIVASCLFGTVSGSPVSDVAATGSFNIPMMKKLGYNPEWAGAVEAVACSGAAFTPPIMGATTFIMAEFLGVSYLKVCIAAIIPCLLYYTALFTQVHYEAVKLKLKGLPKEQLPTVRSALLNGWPLWLIIILLLFLLTRGYGLAYIAFYVVIALFVVSFFKKKTRPNPQVLAMAFEDGGRMAIFIGCALAAAGIIIGTMIQSGFGEALANMIVTYSGGSILLALIICAIVSMLLGLPLPVVIVYITVYVAAVPALIKMGIAPMAAHFFCYLWAVVGDLTPPFAPAVFAASGVAGSHVMKTAWIAMRLGIAAYLVPFAFALSPALVGQAPLYEVLWMGVAAVVGFLFLGSGLSGYFLRRLTVLQRVLFLLGGTLLFLPLIPTVPWVTQLSGLALVGFPVYLQFRDRSRSQPAPEEAG